MVMDLFVVVLNSAAAGILMEENSPAKFRPRWLKRLRLVQGKDPGDLLRCAFEGGDS